jgi:hypothetical protein
LKHFQCTVCAELRVGLKFQQIYYWCSLCRCRGENWFIVRCQVSLNKKSNGKLKCACGMGVGLVTHKFPICGLLSTRVPPVDGWRRLRRQRVGSRRRWQSHCSIDLQITQGDDWHLPLQGDCGKGNLSSMAECQCCPPDDVSNALL